jgi:hypothetical protein
MAANRGVPYVVINRGATDHDARRCVSLRLEGEVTELFPSAVEAALDTNSQDKKLTTDFTDASDW